MNFQTMKGMIENLIKGHRCPLCSSGVKESNIDIIGAAGSTLNIDVECPNCQKHTMIRAEIAQVNLGTFQTGKESLEGLKSYLENFKKTLGNQNNLEVKLETNQLESSSEITSIDDTQIIDLSKTLKSKKLSASDLFGE